jgi:hypothetical protein
LRQGGQSRPGSRRYKRSFLFGSAVGGVWRMLRVSRVWRACYGPCVHVWNMWTLGTHPFQHRSRLQPMRTSPSQRRAGGLDLRGKAPRGDEARPDDELARPGGRHAMRRAESARTAYCWFGWLLLWLFMVGSLAEGGGVRGWLPARAIGLTGPGECSIRTCPALFHDPCQAGPIPDGARL